MFSQFVGIRQVAVFWSIAAMCVVGAKMANPVMRIPIAGFASLVAMVLTIVIVYHRIICTEI